MSAALGLGPPVTPGAAGERGNLAAAFLLAVALHAGALAVLVAWRSTAEVDPPGEQEITIDLAPAMTEAPSVQLAEASQPAGAPADAVPVQPPAEAPAMPRDAPMPAEVQPAEASPVAPAAPAPTPAPAAIEATLPPDTAPIQSASVEAFPLPPAVVPPPEPPSAVAALPPPPAVTARLLPEPRPRPVPRTVERRPAARPEPTPSQDATPGAGESVREAAQSQPSREDTGGAAAMADPDAMRRYAAQLAAALKRRLRYPDAARVAGATGSAVMRFTLDRSGRVLTAAIARSAGHPALDRAALDTVSSDVALPPAPEGVPQAQFTFSVPLRFDIR